jgi:hypothetical protein
MRRFTDVVLTGINSSRFVFIRGFHCIVMAKNADPFRDLFKTINPKL